MEHYSTTCPPADGIALRVSGPDGFPTFEITE